MAVKTLVQALNDALRIALRDDPRVFLMGEDIGKYGGVYRVTKDLLDEFGAARVLDTPISESAIAGACVGAALLGCRPVLDLGFVDFVGTCWDQIFNQAAKYRYLSGGRASIPMVIRMATARAWATASIIRRASRRGLPIRPASRSLCRSTPADAKGLLLAAIDDDDPVIFLEHKLLYNLEGEVPEAKYQERFRRECADRAATSPSSLGAAPCTGRLRRPTPPTKRVSIARSWICAR